MADQYWDDIVFALPLQGVEGSTTFTDLKGHTVSRSGNTVITATPSGPAAYFDGLGDRLYSTSSDYVLGDGDFTIEFFLRPTGTGGQEWGRLIQIGANATAGCLCLVHDGTTDPMNFIFQGWAPGGRDYINLTPAIPAAIVTDTRVHVAVCRIGGIFTIYVAGQLKATGASYSTYAITASAINIGSNHSDAESLQAYIDSILISKVGLYTENFSPPTYLDAFRNTGAVTPPLHSIEAAGTTPIVGTGAIIPIIESVAGSDGAVVASGEVVSPLETISASGTSQAEPATNHASVVPKIESISGYGSTSVVGFGNIIPKRRGTISASGISGEWIGNGTIAPRLESVTASGGTSIIGRAVLEDKKGTVNGSGSSAIAGTGRVVGRIPFISGLGFMGVGGSAQIQTLKDIVSGSGTSYISGSAAIVPSKEKISASRYDQLIYATLNFSRGSVVTGGTPAPLVEPFHFSR